MKESATNSASYGAYGISKAGSKQSDVSIHIYWLKSSIYISFSPLVHELYWIRKMTFVEIEVLISMKNQKLLQLVFDQVTHINQLLSEITTAEANISKNMMTKKNWKKCNPWKHMQWVKLLLQKPNCKKGLVTVQ